MTSFLQTRFYELLRVATRMPFKCRKRYSPTSRKGGYQSCKPLSQRTYKIRHRVLFLRFPQLKKAKDLIWWATYEGNVHVSWTKNSFFLFTSIGVQKRPVSFEVLAPTRLVLQGSHVQRQYRKHTTLRSKSITIKGLLYVPDPHNCKKGMLSDQPWLLRVSSTALLCCRGRIRSKMWRPLWLTLRHMPYGRGTLKILLQSICSKEGLHYCFEQSATKLSSDKQQSTYSRVWISLGDSIPGLNCIAWLGLSHASVSSRILWVRKVWILFSPMDIRSRNLRQKAEKGKFTGSEATTRFPQATCFEKPMHSVPETWGRMYDVLARSAKGTRYRTRNWIPMQPRKAWRN